LLNCTYSTISTLNQVKFFSDFPDGFEPFDGAKIFVKSLLAVKRDNTSDHATSDVLAWLGPEATGFGFWNAQAKP